jgi:pilus assembly protein Flp/PilA
MLAYTVTLLQSVKSDRKGVTALEYGLLAGLIAVAIIGGATALGSSISTMFTDIGTRLGAVPV